MKISLRRVDSDAQNRTPDATVPCSRRTDLEITVS